ncbi:DUF6261 family protein [Carboxylicivirga marina]|uniref:Uncharacterized protein n=1 Tax=Carboxylicivirga marina TaxID=2800988 RepID=A0ABS1HNI3_9BACT|nr:DUF6261 family protein [Carboxylicivirga marina]MBK3518818.1 hypothetical protein [Carboxylicivirga marina]
MINEIKRSYFNPTQTLTLVSRCMSLLTPELSESLGLTTVAAKCSDNMNVLDASLSRTQKSEYTHKLKELDNKCDDAFKMIKALTKAYRYSHIAEEREATNLLYDVMHEHIQNVQELGYVRQMAKLKALDSELSKDKYKAAIARLSIDVYVSYLISCRNDFEQLYIEKNIAEADKKESVQTSDAASMAIESLMALTSIINANLLIAPTPEAQELATNLNSVIEAVSRASK